MGVPFNELNQVYDLGFESLPWGNKGYVASSLREVGSGSEKSAPVNKPTQLARVDALTERLLQLLEAPPSPGHPPMASDKNGG